MYFFFRYCWISSTFTLPKYFEGIQGEDFIYPGVGPSKKTDERVYHAYYQWVPFVLFFQAVCFIAPYGLWRQLVGDKIEVRPGLDRGFPDGLLALKTGFSKIFNIFEFLRDHGTGCSKQIQFVRFKEFINICQG